VAEDIIDLAKGQPHARLLPYGALEAASSQSLTAGKLAQALDYGEKKGSAGLREALAQLLSREYSQDHQYTVDPSHLFITNGASSGLELCLSTLVDLKSPGGKVLVPDPTYFLAFDIFHEKGKMRQV
jgi:DNA-binding transcriptional MocR family regulator